MMKTTISVVALLVAGIAASHFAERMSPMSNLRGGWNGYSCEESLGDTCNIPIDNDSHMPESRCDTEGQQVTYCSDNPDPRSCTVQMFANCIMAGYSICPSIDVICTQDPYNYHLKWAPSGAGSPGCGQVTRCGST
ncbi:hypothetical protein CA85_33050 [Allorhodopirellula solitaria]|uniref:Uncharacterized protein n=1 Tax=Allorhodopirellula solitaria TaxID=2527987 RepID=A0A5C5XPT0_9BACT|nr:hypothetical protein CA85_33050 [Allorhodopirellula solitaria]